MLGGEREREEGRVRWREEKGGRVARRGGGGGVRRRTWHKREWKRMKDARCEREEGRDR